MKKCANCGEMAEDKAKFCSECGSNAFVAEESINEPVIEPEIQIQPDITIQLKPEMQVQPTTTSGNNLIQTGVNADNNTANPTKKKKKAPTVIIILLAALVIALLVGCVYLIGQLSKKEGQQQQNDRTEKTVQNEDTDEDDRRIDDNTYNNSGIPDASGSSTEIKASPDKYTWYIKNYVGRNCASIGYFSWDNARLDRYGEGEIKLVFISEDGAFVEPYDTEVMKKYIVTGQNVAPNTELKLVFRKDENGDEYNSIDTQSIEEIELYVKPIDS